jgi:hypothetical protein
MSKPYPPPKATAPAKTPATCADCRHWVRVGRADGLKAGECRQGPPDVLLRVGPLMGYRQTLETLGACGAAAPR